MKALALVGLMLSAATVGCGGGEVYNGPDQDAACPAELVFDGQTYEGTDRVFRSPRRERLGSAHFTGCDDGHGGEDSNQEVPAWKLPKTEVQDAFLAEMGGDFYLYVSEDLEDPCSVEAVDC